MKSKIRYEPIINDFPFQLTADELSYLLEKLRPLFKQEEDLKIIELNDQ